MAKPVQRTKQEWALVLAAVGLRIFPLPPNGKVPEGKESLGWQNFATSDAARVSGWFEEMPDMNYGVCAGDKFLIIDADEKLGKDGITKFVELNMEQAADDWCMDTFTVKSPSKGRHYYLRTSKPVSNSDRGWPDGIDIRGANGYVVGPGCHTTEVRDHSGKVKTYEGDYSVEDECEFATAPQWVIEKCFQYFEKPKDVEALIDLDLPANLIRARDFLATRTPAIEGSRGDEWTFITICKLKDCGVSEDTALSLMVERGGWNARCEPPWEIAELQTKVQNVYRYGQNRPGNKSDLFEMPGAFSPEELLGQMAQDRAVARIGLAEHLFDPLRIMNSPAHREMVIPEWLPATGYAALLARRGTGKTVQMMDLACRIACDMDWHDMPVMKDFAAIYICGEDDIGARDQFRAWIANNGGMLPDSKRFLFMDTTFDLMSRESVELWVNFLRDELAGRRAVVFVDTWQRATSRGSQNDDVDMQTAVHHTEAIARSFNGPAVVAFHPPKADVNVVLGSSVIENSSTAIWTLEEENNVRRMTVTRIKGKGHGNFQLFEYREIGLGEKDYFGRPVTGVVPIRRGGTSTVGSFEETQLEDNARLAFANLIRLLIMEAERDPDFAEKREKAFSLPDMAERIVSAGDCPEKQILEITTNESLKKSELISARLNKLFVSSGKGVFDLGDGLGQLAVKKVGKSHRFSLQVAPPVTTEEC